MKTFLKTVFILLAVALCSNVSAQSSAKFAYINMQELIVAMPDYDSAMVKMQKVQKELEDTMESMSVEYNRKLDEFSKNSANWTELVRQSKEQEIVTMQQRVQTFQQGAQESLYQENEKLMQPIYEKANKAIENVAKNQNITYVFSAQALSYRAPDAINLLADVKKELGVTK